MTLIFCVKLLCELCGICIWVQVCNHTCGRQGRTASLAASKLWQSRHHCQPVLRLQMCLDAFKFWHGLGEPNTGPHACIARTDTSNHLPSPEIACPYWKKSMFASVVVPVFTELGSLRQKDGKFQASLGYMRFCLKKIFFKWKMFFSCVYTVCFIETIIV